jgi:Ca2+-binding EF-hand superfamily protein
MKKLGMVILLIGIALLLIGTNYSWSQKSPSKSGGVESWFNTIDADGDGKISRDEYMKHAEKRTENRFTQMDVNKDGIISKDEFKEGLSKKGKKGTRKEKEHPKEGKKQ